MATNEAGWCRTRKALADTTPGCVSGSSFVRRARIVVEGQLPSIRRGSLAELIDVTLPQVFGAAWGGRTNGSVFRCLTTPGRAAGFKVA
jgi:hypothetical protein